MKKITPLHSRANVIPRADLHAATHEMMHQGGEIKTELWGKMRLDCSIQYTTPAPRNSFAFGQIAAMGLPDRERPRTIEAREGDIIGFDLFQTGHQLDAAPYYEVDSMPVPVFYTLPWKEILCRFGEGDDLPTPIGDWCMVTKDEVMTRRLVLASAGSTLHLPGDMKQGAATNKGKGTKVKLVAGAFMRFGLRAETDRGDAADVGDWALFNPMDAVDINYTKGRTLTFVRWDDVEQLVEGERKRLTLLPLTTKERGTLADARGNARR